MRGWTVLAALTALGLLVWLAARDAPERRDRAEIAERRSSAARAQDGDASGGASPTEDPDAAARESGESRLCRFWVVDGNGRPVAGARVAAFPRWVDEIGQHAAAKTDAKGTVRVSVAPGNILHIEAEGYEPVARASPSRSSRRALSTFVLAPAATLRVLCVDARGRPVPGAEVRYGPVDTPVCSFDPERPPALFGEQQWTETGERGRTLLTLLADSHYALAARTPYDGSAPVPLRSASRWVAAGQDDVTLVLLACATVIGRVEPAKSVFLAGGGATDMATEDGTFHLERVLPGQRTIVALGEREGRVTLDLRPGETREGVVIRLAPPGPRSYLALEPSEADGTAATGVTFEMTPAPASASAPMFAFDAPPGTEVRLRRPVEAVLRTTAAKEEVQRITVRPRARFRVTGADEIEIGHAEPVAGDVWAHREPPGTPLRWTARAPGRIGSGTIPAPDDGATVELQLRRTATVTGRLVDEAGEHATASLGFIGESVAHGRFRLDGIRPGAFEFVAFEVRENGDWHAPCLVRRTLQLEEGETRDLGDVVVPRYVAVRGRVQDTAGRPVGGALVVLIDAERSLIGRARSQPNGRFVAQGPKGERTLALAEHPDGRMALALDEPLHLVLQQAGRVEAPKELLESADITVHTGDGVRLLSMLDPSIRLPPGEYIAFTSFDDGIPPERKPFTLTPGGTVRLGGH